MHGNLLGRRLAVLALSSAPLARVLPSRAASSSPRELVSTGMRLFKDNKVEESVQAFDDVIKVQPGARPYLWQRGLSLFYADRFQDGAEQFAADVAVNPNDTEEFIWHLLCRARVDGSLERARKSMLSVGDDRRPVMRAAKELFEGSESEVALLQYLLPNRSSKDEFYANLYLGLYREALGDKDSAKTLMRAAVDGKYKSSGDYMYDLARVHMLRRGWL